MDRIRNPASQPVYTPQISLTFVVQSKDYKN